MGSIERVLFIGCGNMGSAMIAGWLASGVNPDRFAIVDPGLSQGPHGIKLFSSAQEAANAAEHEAVVLGFKPQQLPSLAPVLQQLIGPGITVCSLLAGITLTQLGQAFPRANAHLRVMPNLAVRINKSPVILSQRGLNTEQRDGAHALFDRLGHAVWLEDEGKFDLVTALAGSGPGFVYRFIDALAEAASSLGLDRDQATSLAMIMVDGASSLAARSEVSPGELADRVASPGGMTREGLNVLDADKALLSLLIDTLAATRDKGAELSAGGD